MPSPLQDGLSDVSVGEESVQGHHPPFQNHFAEEGRDRPQLIPSGGDGLAADESAQLMHHGMKHLQGGEVLILAAAQCLAVYGQALPMGGGEVGREHLLHPILHRLGQGLHIQVAEHAADGGLAWYSVAVKGKAASDLLPQPLGPGGDLPQRILLVDEGQYHYR